MSAVERLDHVAIGTSTFDATLATLTELIGMRVRRHGTHNSSGRRIVMLGNGERPLIELIETVDTDISMQHVAFRVDDVESTFAALIAGGCVEIRPPHALAAAKAETALVEDPTGLRIQLITYGPDSPDILPLDGDVVADDTTSSPT